MELLEATRDSLIAVVEWEIIRANDDWAKGRATSPSELDYVILADRVLTHMLPGYIGSTEEGRQFNADVLFDCGETYFSAILIAEYLVDALVAE